MKFNSKDVNKVHELFLSALRPALSDFFKTNGENFIALVSELEVVVAKWQQDPAFEKKGNDKNELCKTYKKELLDVLSRYAQLNSSHEFRKFVGEYENIADEALKSIKLSITTKDKFAGYTIRFLANPLTSIQKSGVNMGRFFILLYKKTLNVFLKLLKKKSLELVVYQKRKIPFRYMAKHYLVSEVFYQTTSLYDKTRKFEHQSLIAIWEKDALLDIECQKNNDTQPDDKLLQHAFEALNDLIKQIKKEYLKLLQTVEQDIVLSVQQNCETLDEKMQVVDTLNLPKKTFELKRLLKKKADILAVCEKNIDLWKNTRTALFDDWSVDAEITLLNYSVFEEFKILQDKIDVYIRNLVNGNINNINSFIENSKLQIRSNDSSAKKLKAIIETEYEKVIVDLSDQVLAATIEYLTACFNGYFDVLRQKTNQLVDTVSANRAFIKNKNYLKGYPTSELKYISPKDLLNFEALPVFTKRVGMIESWTDQQLEKARINLLGLGTVCDFSLESALVKLEQDTDEPAIAAEVATEGLERALSHLQKTIDLLAGIQTGIARDLKNAILQFDVNIQKLKETDNIFELNLKIAKIQAIEKTKAYKVKLLIAIRKAIPQAKAHMQEVARKVNVQVKRIQKRIGVQEKKKYVSFEMSEFMEQSEQSLKNLPFVYQRLYKLNPTDEERFFVNRRFELETLIKSFKNWEKDRYITIALIGEKGGGVTSLINYFFKLNAVDIKVFRQLLTEKIYTSEVYYQFFSETFGVEKFESNEQIINFLNNREKTAIVVLENLQHMFIKQVNGFDCMNMFFELMAHTMKKILWIGAYTTYTWNYLNKTIHVGNYFTNEIYLQQMTKDSIEEIIYKRNRLSGYQIVFQADNDSLMQKKYMKMNDEDKQLYLRKKFFATLRQLSSGNISLAQLYWLRATQLANEEEINIAPIHEFDFSFLAGLSNEELFAMQTIIIHDGLNMDDFTRVMGKSIHNSRNLLMPMLEKGLLIKPKLKYNINPIIFKPVAGYLELNNYIN